MLSRVSVLKVFCADNVVGAFFPDSRLLFAGFRAWKGEVVRRIGDEEDLLETFAEDAESVCAFLSVSTQTRLRGVVLRRRVAGMHMNKARAIAEAGGPFR